MGFAGNSSGCIKTGVVEGTPITVASRCPSAAAVCFPSPRDRNYPHLDLLPLVKYSEYSCKTLHTYGERVSERGYSRKPSFRCREFSETQSVALVILGNPIYRANPLLSGLGLHTTARTTFRCMGFSEI